MKPRAKGDEYQVYRESASKHWEDMMKLCNEKGSTASREGRRSYANDMFEKAKTHHKFAVEANENASKAIFRSRNATINNEIIFDLHGQQLPEALQIVKQQLKHGVYMDTVRRLKIITGQGIHSIRDPVIKNGVKKFLEDVGIECVVDTENSGILVIDLFRHKTDFGFVETR